MKKQSIIIIGATSGIGRALFEKYAVEVNRIGIVGRRTYMLDELRQEHPDTTITATADITKLLIGLRRRASDYRHQRHGLDICS